MDVENIISIEELEKNINILKKQISEQCEKNGRDPDEITSRRKSFTRIRKTSKRIKR